MSKELELKFCLELDELLKKYNASMDWASVTININDEDEISRKRRGEKDRLYFYIDNNKELQVGARVGDGKMKKVSAKEIEDKLFQMILHLEELEQIVKSEDSLISVSFSDYDIFTKNIKTCLKKLKQAKNIARKAV